MVSLKILEKDVEISDPVKVKEYLARFGIKYEKWSFDKLESEDASPEKILQAYSDEINRLKMEGGYSTADVIDINRNTPGLEEMLNKFDKEHWHDEDEVRYTLKGHGLFHVSASANETLSIQVGKGDLLRVPSGTKHWFNLCTDMEIRAIRLFPNKSGWTPYYTGSGNDGKFMPLCFGPSFIKPSE
jgi:1,2-dihydroxy-3-keto-5-methylthiopentene dioxygenase